MSNGKEKRSRASREIAWEVRLAGEGFSGMGETITVHAAWVEHKDNWTTLRDSAGSVIFGSPMVRYVRRASDALQEGAPPLTVNVSAGDLAADAGAADAGKP